MCVAHWTEIKPIDYIGQNAGMPDMKGKVVLITGASDGIGKATAHALAKMGATLALAGRNREKTEAAAKEIATASGNSNITTIVADLSVLAHMRDAARQFRDQHRRLDVLINNAGAMFSARQLTPDGIERTWALNHLSYFVITQALTDLLKLSAPARIINVSSRMHTAAAGLNWQDINFERGYSAMNVYGHSKLANVMHANALARRMAGLGVTANSLHPGVVASKFGHEAGGIWKPAMKVFQRVGGISTDDGAATSVHLASSPDVAGITGKYWDRSKPVDASRAAGDPDTQDRLWALSERMTA
jgi:retinol dehydrogenase 12